MYRIHRLTCCFHCFRVSLSEVEGTTRKNICALRKRRKVILLDLLSVDMNTGYEFLIHGM